MPVLANITEFGSTPLFTVEELRSADVSLVLYPLSAFRAMSKAALSVYRRDPQRRDPEERDRPHADPGGTLRLSWITMPLNKNLMRSFPGRKSHEQ